jgi:AsmA protein
VALVGVMKKLAWGIGGALLLVGGATTYLVATFDPNRYKSELTDWVKAHHERTLTLQGPVTLSVWPRVHVRLQQVGLSEHLKADSFASIDELDLAVQVMPLLDGRLRVGQVTASGVALHYARDAQGHSNIDDLIKPSATAPASAGQPLSFDVEGIHLTKVAATVDDAITGTRGQVMIDKFESGRLADGVKTDVKLTADATLTAPKALQIRLDGKFAMTPDLAKGSVSVEKFILEAEGHLKGSAVFKSNLRAESAQWNGERRAAVAEGVLFEGSGVLGEGAQALTLEAVGLTLKHFDYDPQAQALKVSDLDARLQGARGSQPMSAQLQWPSLEVKGETLKGSPLKGQLNMEGPVAVSATFSSQAPSGSFSQIKVPGLNADIKVTMAGQGGQREIAGKVSADVQAKPSTSELSLDGLAINTRITEPSLQPLALKAQGHLKAAAPGAVNWGLQGDLNGNAFNTTGQAKLGAGAPNVQAVAHFVSLDLNRWLPASAAAPASGAAPAGGDVPIDLSGLKAVNGRFELTADALAWQHYKLAKAKVLAQLDQGHLTLQELSGNAWGGHIALDGHATAGAIGLTANAQGVNIEPLLKDVASKDVLEGVGQVKANITTTGKSIKQLTAALNGTAALVLRDGAVKGINLAKTLREAKAKLGGHSSDAIQQAKQVEKTDFTELTASFQIANGVATNKDLAAKSPFLRVSGAGDINLVQQRIDYLVNATVTGTIRGQDGAEIDALKGLTVPVKLSGPFTALDWKISWSGVALGSMQNTLKGQLDAKVDKAGVKLQDQLKAKLLGSAASPASGASEPQAKPEDIAKQKLKDKLKGLFR